LFAPYILSQFGAKLLSMTADFENSPWFEVQNNQQAQLLHSANHFLFFRPFFTQENTVSQAAKTIGVSVLKMYRKVQQLETAGLLVQTRLEARAGKAVKYYKSVADRFFVPNRLLSAENFETLLLEEDDVWRRKLLRGIAQVSKDAMQHQGMYIFREAQGRVRKVNHRASGMNALPEDTAMGHSDSAVWSDWSLLRLEQHEVKALHDEMRALFNKYYNKPSAKRRGRFHIVRTAIAPMADEDALVFMAR
jgi:hypothetical protein